MNEMMMKLWSDDAGFILSAEAVFLFTITVLGIIIGMVAVRDATVMELFSVANAISSLDTAYSFNGLTFCEGFTNGSSYGGNPQTTGFSNNGVTHPQTNPLTVCP